MNDLAESKGVSNPLVLMQAMIDKGTDPDALKKMMDLVERWQANMAKQAYTESMNACQADMPPILRDAKNIHTNSTYASYEALNWITKPIYTRHGFSLSFGEQPQEREGMVRIYCDVIHKGGHSERYQGDFPRDGVGIKGNANMTALQGTGSTYSYAKRYLQKNIWNLAEADEDNDGSNEILTQEEVAQVIGAIQAKAKSKNLTGEAYERYYAATLDWMKVEKVPDLPRKDLAKVLDGLKVKKNGGTHANR